MADESDNDLRVKLLLGENLRFYSENCHLKSLNSNLTSKLKELRLKVENLLLVFSEIPQGHGIKDTVRINDGGGVDPYSETNSYLNAENASQPNNYEGPSMPTEDNLDNNDSRDIEDGDGGVDPFSDAKLDLSVENTSQPDKNEGPSMPTEDNLDNNDSPDSLSDIFEEATDVEIQMTQDFEEVTNVEIHMNQDFEKVTDDEKMTQNSEADQSPHKNVMLKAEVDLGESMTSELRDVDESSVMLSFSCAECSYVGDCMEDLNQHIEIKHGDLEKGISDNYNCSICEFRFCSEVDLSKHIRTTHSQQNRVSCNICKKSTKSVKALKIHMKLHAKEKYKCNTCNYKCSKPKTLESHKKTHIGTIIKCDECSYSSLSPAALKIHTKRKHGEKKYFCDKCPFSCRIKVGLDNHIGRIHEKTLINCDKCDFKCFAATFLTYHRQEAHEGVIRACDKCSYTTTTVLSLNAHKRRTHGEIFYCDHCPYSSRDKFVVKRHIEEKHLRQKNHSCDMCDFKSCSKDRLKGHKKRVHEKNNEVHEGVIRAYDKCSYTTTTVLNLNNHKRRTHGELSYCYQCPYSSRDKFVVKRHIQEKHLKQKNHSCDICDFKSYRNDHLKEHKKRVHEKNC